jgi:universal stress protein A
MSYHHVLVAIDFSEATERVVRRGLEVAQRYEARVTLLHVVDYLPPIGFADDFSPSPAVLIDDEALIENGTSSLEELAARLALPDDAQRVVLVGSPKQLVVKEAAERGADLVVIGSHGVRGLGRLLGTTATSVLNDAVCDVLAVRVGV